MDVTEDMIEAGRMFLYDDGWDEDLVGEMDLERLFTVMLEASEMEPDMLMGTKFG